LITNQNNRQKEVLKFKNKDVMLMIPHLYQKNHTFSQWSTGGAYLHFLYEAGLYNIN